MHGTWLQPSGPLGYVEQQSGSIHGVNGNCPAHCDVWSQHVTRQLAQGSQGGELPSLRSRGFGPVQPCSTSTTRWRAMHHYHHLLSSSSSSLLPTVRSGPNDVQEGCDPDIADAPVRMWRRSGPGGDGSVFSLASVDLGSRGLLGPDARNLSHRCDVYANSTRTEAFEMYAKYEWVQGGR